jgi:glycosyltransferase involved in cell wall biosynthesis
MSKTIKNKIKNFNLRLFVIKYSNLIASFFQKIEVALIKKFFRVKSINGKSDLANVVDILNVNFYDWNGKELYRGGAERYVFDLACLIKEKGYVPRIIQNANNSFEKKYSGIDVIGIPAKSGWNFKKLFNYYVNYFEGSNFVISSPLDIACSVNDKKIIGINHGIHWDGMSNRFFLRSKDYKNIFNSLGNIESAVCVDTNFINWVRTFDRILANKLVYIPNYYDADNFLFKDKEFNDEKIVITYPRRIYPQRGSRLVFDILDEILEKYSNVFFHFVGQAEEEDKDLLEGYIKKYGNRIKWSILDMDQMDSAYEDSQIILIPTIASEGTSLSCIEAMATNNAIITTDIGGLPNLVINDFNGMLISPNRKELRDAVLELISNREKRIRLAKNAGKVAKVFEKKNWESKWSKVLDDFLK